MLLCSGLANCFFEDLEGVDVGYKDDRPEEFVGPPTRDSFGGIVCWDGDVWGEFLCVWGKEELVIGAANNASGVGVHLYVDNLGVVGTSDVDEGV